MIRDPVIVVECDECGYVEERGLTVIARGWDDRGLERSLKNQGWKIENDGTYCLCPECVQEKEND